jgi:hypothetical protein
MSLVFCNIQSTYLVYYLGFSENINFYLLRIAHGLWSLYNQVVLNVIKEIFLTKGEYFCPFQWWKHILYLEEEKILAFVHVFFFFR